MTAVLLLLLDWVENSVFRQRRSIGQNYVPRNAQVPFRNASSFPRIPSGIIKSQELGKKPNTLPPISNNPSTGRSAIGTERLVHSIKLFDWPLIHVAVPCGSVFGDGSRNFILVMLDQKQRRAL